MQKGPKIKVKLTSQIMAQEAGAVYSLSREERFAVPIFFASLALSLSSKSSENCKQELKRKKERE